MNENLNTLAEMLKEASASLKKQEEKEAPIVSESNEIFDIQALAERLTPSKTQVEEEVVVEDIKVNKEEILEDVGEEIVEEVQGESMSAIDELKSLMSELSEATKNIETISTIEEAESIQEEMAPSIDRIQELARKLTNENAEDSLNPLDQKFVTLDQFNKHYSDFLNKIQAQLSSVGGGGEVNFRYLDDVNRSTMSGSNDNHVLEYDASSGKVQFTSDIGPIDTILFNTNHEAIDHPVGTLCWDNADQTLNLYHPNGVTQQIGQESYAYIRNGTANTIVEGTPVMFSGAEDNGVGEARLLVSPLISDGSADTLYGLGIATQDILPNQDGRVTIWGKVRDLDTSDYNIGDILYGDPNNVGQLTNVKPTTPSIVIPFAAVIKVGETDGEIFVRPTIEQEYNYGTILSTTTQGLANANEATAVTFNTAQDNTSIDIDENDSTRIVFEQSGLFTVDINAQVLSNNSSAKNVYLWVRKNGIDENFSTRTMTLDGNGVYRVLHITYNISVDANDYIQVMWASNDSDVELEAAPATAFAPASPSVYVHLDQAAL